MRSKLSVILIYVVIVLIHPVISQGVDIPGSGFSTMEYRPDNKVAQIFWRGSNLVYRERAMFSNWVEQTVLSQERFNNYNPGMNDYPAALAHDSKSNPHIWVEDQDFSGLLHVTRTNGAWVTLGMITNECASDFDFGFLGQSLHARIGPGNVPHLVINTGSKICYARKTGNTWNWSTIHDNVEYSILFTAHAKRFLDLAIASNNVAHVVYCPLISGGRNPFDLTFFSELRYASNPGGVWSSSMLVAKTDNSSDAGLGASIAIAPNGTIGVASFRVERVNTGSAQFSHLLYLVKNGPNWTTQVVASSPDGYVAGDGPKFTGAQPMLRYDQQNRPMILFSDHASQHFASFGADEFAGQIRLAYRKGANWTFQTLFSQRNPVENQIFYPIFATSFTNAPEPGVLPLGIKPPVSDYNRDGRTDFAVFDRAGGSWFIKTVGGNLLHFAGMVRKDTVAPNGAVLSTTYSFKQGEIPDPMSPGGKLLLWNHQWGWSTAKPVVGDYDGDGYYDQAVFDTKGGFWYVRSLDNRTLGWKNQWGWSTARPVPGDYNGDGKWDQAVFDTAGGFWYIKSLSGPTLSWKNQWGWSTAKPVPGDYDGDEKWDQAVFDTVGGFWYIKSLSGSTLSWKNQWGWSTALVVPGDYNGDGKWDQAVFDTVGGFWYIKSLSGPTLLWKNQWGWSTAKPISGDFDGDGKYDLAVVDTITGKWYVKSLDGRIISWGEEWGWNGVLTPTLID